MILEGLSFSSHFFFDGFNDNFLCPVVFFEFTAERNHDFWFDIVAKFLTCFNSSLDDGFGEHSIDFWIGNAKSDTTEAHHWVGLVKLVDSVFDLLFADVKSSG